MNLHCEKQKKLSSFKLMKVHFFYLDYFPEYLID